MPQLSLYLDNSAMESLRSNAAQEEKTLSKYVKDILDSHSDKAGLWPKGFFGLYGAISDDDGFTEPQELSWGLDAPRSAF